MPGGQSRAENGTCSDDHLNPSNCIGSLQTMFIPGICFFRGRGGSPAPKTIEVKFIRLRYWLSHFLDAQQQGIFGKQPLKRV